LLSEYCGAIVLGRLQIMSRRMKAEEEEEEPEDEEEEDW
jgi:hypothetical protein